MYADDLLLLSISLTKLQAMVDLCIKAFSEIDLIINMNKSFCMRIDPFYKSKVSNVVIRDSTLKWENEMCFLGVSFGSEKSLKCNLQSVRQKYFRALNGIFGKIGTFSSATVSLSLVHSFCVPLLIYGIEAFNVSRSMYIVLEAA